VAEAWVVSTVAGWAAAVSTVAVVGLVADMAVAAVAVIANPVPSLVGCLAPSSKGSGQFFFNPRTIYPFASRQILTSR
jgi:hypothetical protein